MTNEDRLAQRQRAGKWLREQRERRGFSAAAELGRAIGASKEVVWSYEAGRSSVPDDRAEQIAEALGMDLIEVRRNLGLWVPPQSDERPKREPRVGGDFAERIERILSNPAALKRADDLLRAARIPEIEEEDERRGQAG